MKIEVADASDFKRLLEALVDELIEANEHFRLHQQLSAAIPEDQAAFNHAPAFWFLTLRAHLDATLMRLCRAYDLYKTSLNLSKSSLNLRSFLETIQENLYLFDEPNFRERLKNNPFVDSLATDLQKPAERLQKDLEFVQNAPAVKNLIIWRNNFIAHRSMKTTLAFAAFINKNPLPFTEIQELIDKGLEIMNHYSGLYDANRYMPFEAKDYKRVLNAIRRDLERQDARIQKEIDAMNALASQNGPNPSTK